MKLRLPQALLTAFATVTAAALPLATTVGTGAMTMIATGQAQADTYANVTYTSATAASVSTGSYSMTASEGAPAFTNSLLVSNFTGTLTLHGGLAEGSTTSIATNGSGANGGYGGRMFINSAPNASLTRIVMDRGVEVALNENFYSASSNVTLELNNASFYLNKAGGSLQAAIEIGDGGVRLNGNGAASYTLAGAISGSGNIYCCTYNASHSISILGDTSGYTGTFTRSGTGRAPNNLKTWKFGNGGAMQGSFIGGNVGREDVWEKVEYNYSGNYEVRGTLYTTNINFAAGTGTFKGNINTDGLSFTAGAKAVFSNTATTVANAFSIASKSALTVSNGSTFTANGLITLAAGANTSSRTSLTNAGTLVINGSLTTANNTAFNNTGTLRLGDGASLTLASGTSSSSLSGAIELGAGSIINTAVNLTQSGEVRGTTGSTNSTLIKQGAGTFTITGTVSNLSGLTVTGGTLKIQRGGALNLSTVTLNGGALVLYETSLTGGANTFGSLTMSANGTIEGTNHRTRIKVDSLALNGRTLTIKDTHSSDATAVYAFAGDSAGSGTIDMQQDNGGKWRHVNVSVLEENTLDSAVLNFSKSTSGSNNDVRGNPAVVSLAIGAENVNIGGLGSTQLGATGMASDAQLMVVSNAVDITTVGSVSNTKIDASDGTVRTLTITGAGGTYYGAIKDKVNLGMNSTAQNAVQTYAGDMTAFDGTVSVTAGTLAFTNALTGSTTATVNGGTLQLDGGASFTAVSGTGGTIKSTADTAQDITIRGAGGTYAGSLGSGVNVVMDSSTTGALQQFTGDLSGFNGNVTVNNGALTLAHSGATAASIQNLYLADGKSVTISGAGETTLKNFALAGDVPATPVGTTIIKQGAGKLTLETGLLSDTVLQLEAGSLGGTHSLGTVQVGTGTTLDALTLNGGTLTFGTGYFNENATAATLSSTSVFTAGNIDMGINFADVYADGLQYTLFNQAGSDAISWSDTTLNGFALGSNGTFYVTDAQNQILGQASVTHADGKIMLTFEDIEDVPDSLTWNGSTGVWTSGTSTWEGDGLTYADGDLVFFTPDSEGTVTLQGQLDPTSVNVTGTYTFAAVDADSGLTGEGVLTVGDGTTATALTLNSNNSGRTGATIINDNASLTICSADALGSGGVDISADGTLNINNTGATAIELDNRIGGTGTVDVTGSVSLTGDVASFGGVFAIEQGADLTVAVLASSAGANLKAADSVLTVTEALSGEHANNITGTGTLNVGMADSGINTISTADTFAGTVNVTGGVLAVGSSSAGNGNFLLQNGVDLALQNGETANGGNLKFVGNNHNISVADAESATLEGSFAGYTADGSASGATALTKTGTGTLVLAANTDITAGFNVNAGILQTGGTGAAIHGTLTVNTDGTLDLSGGALTVDNITLNGGSISTGSMTVNGTFDTGSTNVGTLGKGKTFVDPSGSSATAKLTNFTGGENFKKTGSGDLVVGGTISLTKSTMSEGVFQVVLGNSAVNLGEIVLDGGTFSVYNNNQTGNWNTITKLTVNNNASKLNSTWNRSLIDIQELVFTEDGDTLVIEDTHTSSGIAVYKFSGTTTGTGAIDFRQSDKDTNRNTSIMLAGTDTLKNVVLNYSTSSSAINSVNATDKKAVNAVVIGTGNAKLAGLESGNDFSDYLYLISRTDLIANGATLTASDNTARTLTLTGDGDTHTFYGKVMGNVNITMGDTGDGAVTMAEGSKQVFAGNAAAFNGTITVNSGTLQFDQNVGKLDTPNASSAAGIVMNGGTLQLGGDTHASTLTGDSATAVITSEATGTAMLFLGDNSTSETVASNFAGTITGSMGVTVRNGANDGGQHNTLTLTGKNTYSGATAIWNNAKLDLEDGGSIGNETSGNQFIIYGRAAQLNISGGGYIQNSGIKISNDGEGATAQLQGFVMTKTGIDASQATVAASQGTISNAAITVSANGGEDKYSVANVALADSTVTVASGKTLAIGDNVGASGLSLSTASGATEAAKLTSDSTGHIAIANGDTLKVTDMEISNIAFATADGTRGTVGITAGALLKGSVSEGASETAPTDTKALMASCSLKNADVVVSAVGATEAFAIATDHTLGTPYTLNVMSGVQLVDMDSFSLTLNGMEKYTNVQVYWEVVEPATQSLMPGPAISQALAANGVNVERYNGSAVVLNPGDGKVVNVWVTYNIPEPATGVLSMLALAGLAARRRRK